MHGNNRCGSKSPHTHSGVTKAFRGIAVCTRFNKTAQQEPGARYCTQPCKMHPSICSACRQSSGHRSKQPAAHAQSQTTPQPVGQSTKPTHYPLKQTDSWMQAAATTHQKPGCIHGASLSTCAHPNTCVRQQQNTATAQQLTDTIHPYVHTINTSALAAHTNGLQPHAKYKPLHPNPLTPFLTHPR
jgi:hypothetical protein